MRGSGFSCRRGIGAAGSSGEWQGSRRCRGSWSWDSSVITNLIQKDQQGWFSCQSFPRIWRTKSLLRILSSLLPWNILVYSPFILPRKSSSSVDNTCICCDGPLLPLSSLSSSRVRDQIAFCLLCCVSFSFSYIRCCGGSFQVLLLISNYKIIDKMTQEHGYKTPKIFDSFVSTVKRFDPQSRSSSTRKPIFNSSSLYASNPRTSTTRPLSYNPSLVQPKQSVREDLCGCEHTLDPCEHIQELSRELREAEMRAEYERVQGGEERGSVVQVRRKYFKYLPQGYPELYHAHLTGVLSNLHEDISFNEFMSLAWIQYHAKLEYLTYFLFSDLRKSLQNKRKFMDTLDHQLIKYQVNLQKIFIEAREKKLPLSAFLSDYYESVAAILVPLSQYGKFLKLLLKSGGRLKLKLLILLIVKKRETLFDLVAHYAVSNSSLMEASRQLHWQRFFEQMAQIK